MLKLKTRRPTFNHDFILFLKKHLISKTLTPSCKSYIDLPKIFKEKESAIYHLMQKFLTWSLVPAQSALEKSEKIILENIRKISEKALRFKKL